MSFFSINNSLLSTRVLFSGLNHFSPLQPEFYSINIWSNSVFFQYLVKNQGWVVFFRPASQSLAARYTSPTTWFEPSKVNYFDLLLMMEKYHRCNIFLVNLLSINTSQQFNKHKHLGFIVILAGETSINPKYLIAVLLFLCNAQGGPPFKIFSLLNFSPFTPSWVITHSHFVILAQFLLKKPLLLGCNPVKNVFDVIWSNLRLLLKYNFYYLFLINHMELEQLRFGLLIILILEFGWSKIECLLEQLTQFYSSVDVWPNIGMSYTDTLGFKVHYNQAGCELFIDGNSDCMLNEVTLIGVDFKSASWLIFDYFALVSIYVKYSKINYMIEEPLSETPEKVIPILPVDSLKQVNTASTEKSVLSSESETSGNLPKTDNLALVVAFIGTITVVFTKCMDLVIQSQKLNHERSSQDKKEQHERGIQDAKELHERYTQKNCQEHAYELLKRKMLLEETARNQDKITANLKNLSKPLIGPKTTAKPFKQHKVLSPGTKSWSFTNFPSNFFFNFFKRR